MDDLLDQSYGIPNTNGLTIGTDNFSIQRADGVTMGGNNNPVPPTDFFSPPPPLEPLSSTTASGFGLDYGAYNQPPPPSSYYAPTPDPIPEFTVQNVTIPAPDEHVESRKRAREDYSLDDQSAAKRPHVEVNREYIPTYETISAADAAQGDRELDILEYREEMKEWQASKRFNLPYDIDSLPENELLKEYRKYRTLVINQDTSEMVMAGLENSFIMADQHGGPDMTGLQVAFSESAPGLKTAVNKFVRTNMRHLQVPLWMQIGASLVGIVTSVWLTNYLSRVRREQEALERGELPQQQQPPSMMAPPPPPPRNSREAFARSRANM